MDEISESIKKSNSQIQSVILFTLFLNCFHLQGALPTCPSDQRRDPQYKLALPRSS